MATNSTLLAIQCAVGVQAPRCHLRRNMVTKTHKTIIMASNPAIQYEAGVLVSTPCQLGRNLATTKRNKTIVAAFPTKTEIISGGIPFYTKGDIKNLSGGTINLDDEDIWQGARPAPGMFPEEIDNQKEGNFEHSAVSRGKVAGSVAGLEYKLTDGKKWIIAWSNPLNEKNKVYTEIVDQVADWEEIKSNLVILGAPQYSATNLGYSSDITIDPDSGTPTMMAKLSPAP